MRAVIALARSRVEPLLAELNRSSLTKIREHDKPPKAEYMQQVQAEFK